MTWRDFISWQRDGHKNGVGSDVSFTDCAICLYIVYIGEGMAVGCERVCINSSEENGSPSHTHKKLHKNAGNIHIYTHSACSESVTDKATKLHS